MSDLVGFGRIQTDSDGFGWIRSYLVVFGRILIFGVNLVGPCRIWSDLVGSVGFGRIWLDLVGFSRIWSDLVGLSGIRLE